MVTLIGTGMRLGEAETLRVCNVRFGEGCEFAVQDSKTEEGIRPVFGPKWVAGVLRKHIESESLSGDNLLFRPIHRSTIGAEHHRARKLAGIVMLYKLKDHRHTFAVTAAKQGMPIPQIATQLGHTDIKVTMRYAKYHPDYRDNSRYFAKMERAWGVDDHIHALPRDGADTPEHAKVRRDNG
jgi:integrase